MVKCVYVCGRISVNSTNVQSLLDAANQYQIEPVKKMCVEFLKGQIDATNCLGENVEAVKINSLSLSTTKSAEYFISHY